MEKKRIQSLDVVKIIAMLMVLMLHVNVFKEWSKTGSTMDYYVLAGIAIPLFFMTSGYLMANKTATWRYVLKKIWGIVRFSLLISVIIYGLKYMIHGEAIFSFPYCFLQLYDLGVFWYFGAMIFVYAFLPLLLRIINSKKFFLPAIICLIIFCHVIVVMNHWGFEARHPWQAFRLYYWFMYFLIGAYIRRNPACISKVRLWWILPAVLVYAIFCHIGIVTTGIEYYFGSLPCIAYAFITFGALIKLPIHDNKIVGQLSATFLPVYAFHWFFLQECFHHNPIYYINRNLHYLPATAIDFFIVAVVMLTFGLIVMRIPYADKIFKI